MALASQLATAQAAKAEAATEHVSRRFSLKGRVAVVTGAAGASDGADAVTLAHAGADFVGIDIAAPSTLAVIAMMRTAPLRE